VIEETYQSAFSVRIETHYPRLVGVFNSEGALNAAAGWRSAHEDALFIEHYLDEPIELILARRLKKAIARREVAEIGSFATRGAGGAAQLCGALALRMHEEGVRYAVATATRRLRRAFHAFGFGAHELAPAHQARMPDCGRGWDGYFAHDPALVWGCVENGLVRAAALGAGH
jgi:hypothetical protein